MMLLFHLFQQVYAGFSSTINQLLTRFPLPAGNTDLIATSFLIYEPPLDVDNTSPLHAVGNTSEFSVFTRVLCSGPS